MSRTVLESEVTGHHHVCGTDWPIERTLVRDQRPGRRPTWIHSHGVERGIAYGGATEYRTLRAARAAWEGGAS